MRVFINYRRGDADATALHLYERLAARYDADNVFLDIRSLQAGTQWLSEIMMHGSEAGAFIALIGPDWVTRLKARQAPPPDEPDDIAALELELALRRWPGKVIPVLVGGATMPPASALPRPIRALADCHAVELRHASFDADTNGLIAAIEAAPAQHEAPGRAARPVPLGRANEGRSESRPRAAQAVPDEAHYDAVLECIVQEGTVVPVLGSRVRGSLPDADDLAAHLADTFKLDGPARDLAEVAQHVAVTKGPSFLHRAMSDVLRLELEPHDVHRFLARLPRRLEELGRPGRYQMIITTNYDSSLERAFDAEGEAYDLAVFLAGGPDRGKFVHVPWRADPELITEPSKYRGFPIDSYDDLERTVIVKVLGAIAGGEGGVRWDRSYVLTEDHYIDYLASDQIGNVIPLQILNKLTSSHCLFLGYAMRDWSLRVFLKRAWQGRPLEDKSWAIERHADPLEKDFWSSLQVELLVASPADYANSLDERLSEWRADGT